MRAKLPPLAVRQARGASPERLDWTVLVRPSGTASDWNVLSDAAQLELAREAMVRAQDAIARHAELLADEIESGAVADRGGAEALRLLARMVRLTGRDPLAPAGSA